MLRQTTLVLKENVNRQLKYILMFNSYLQWSVANSLFEAKNYSSRKSRLNQRRGSWDAMEEIGSNQQAIADPTHGGKKLI